MSSRDQPSLTGASQRALERLGRLSLRDMSMDELLKAVADSAKAVMPGAPEASIFIQARRGPVTVASTGRLATDLDEVQYDENHGPCLTAAATGTLIEIVDTRTEQRWPDYTRRAAALGNLSSLSLPLRIDGTGSGALNVYAREPGAFDEESRKAAAGFIPYASVAIGNLEAYRSATDMVGNLQAALESRAVIDQAKGILMERYKLTADQAFQLLARTSMITNRKVREVAEQLVLTGDLPTGRH
jgi:transcriptional regulator with GAF, ATPase, and Fis domain